MIEIAIEKVLEALKGKPHLLKVRDYFLAFDWLKERQTVCEVTNDKDHERRMSSGA